MRATSCGRQACSSFAGPVKPLFQPRGACLRVKSSSDAVPTVLEVEVQASWPNGSTSFKVESGEYLRTALIAQKVDLYNMWGKVMNCNGGGSCGTCIVEVLEGGDVLTERTATEEKKLKGKPATYRLACQTLCGDGTNAGKVSIRTQPK